tara:strand:- start:41 stop:418 length:378 start_codon:yes stop_codon:yes gene_type:complete
MPVVASVPESINDSNGKPDTYTFAGICRSGSKLEEGSARTELFTIRLRGQDTVLNSTGEILYPGDAICWTFGPQTKATEYGFKRIQIKKLNPAAEEDKKRQIGRVLHCAAPGKPLDILINDSYWQ